MQENKPANPPTSPLDHTTFLTEIFDSGLIEMIVKQYTMVSYENSSKKGMANYALPCRSL